MREADQAPMLAEDALSRERAAWRHTLVRALLRALAALATLGFPVMAHQGVTARDPVGLGVLGSLYVLLVASAYSERLPYYVRTGVLLCSLSFVAGAGLVRIGFQIGPGVSLALCVVLSGLLIGRRALYVAYGAAVLALVAIGMYQVRTGAASVDASLSDVTQLRNWLRNAAVFGLFAGVLGVAVTYVVSQIEAALGERTEALAAIRAASDQRDRAQRALTEAERTIAEMQKMEALGRLAGGVAHDFNNNLLIMLGWADLLRAKLPADEGVGARAALDQISSAGHRASSLVQQLLAFARRNVLAPQPVGVPALLADVARMLERTIPATIEVVSEVAPNLPSVHADPTLLHQAVLNLCLNARDAMPDGGRLTLSAQLDAGVDAEWVRITVRDTGIGMDEDTKARAFEPFFSTKGELGTGLGLASVYSTIQQFGGRVELDSAPGKGSALSLFLRRSGALPLPARPPKSGAAPAPAPSCTVLVVEDDPGVRLLIRSVVEGAGHKVLEAANGDDALALLRRYRARIDLMCTDAIMPGASASAVVRAFRALYGGAPVLLCSGHVDDKTRSELGDLALRYMQKPFAIADFRRVLDELLAPDAHEDARSA